MRLMVVDDSEVNQQLFRRYLSSGGFQDLLFASSAFEAFELLGIATTPIQPQPVDLILMDVVMPEMDGILAIQQIRAIEQLRDIPIMMITANRDSQLLREAFEIGAIDYLVKPVDEVELLARVHAALTLKFEMERRKAREQELLGVTRELERVNAELLRQSNLDGLTSVANRRYFDEMLGKEWVRHRLDRAPISLIMADIDHFKRYNDSAGHLAGDQCLRRIADALVETVHRPNDLVARFGGEEFAVILSKTDEAGAQAVAGMIRKAIEALEIVHPDPVVGGCVTLSLGVATHTPGEHDVPDALVAAADEALYAAKGARPELRIAAPAARKSAEPQPPLIERMARPPQPSSEALSMLDSLSGDSKIKIRVNPRIASLVPNYIRTQRALGSLIRDALDREDYQRIRMIGHDLRGSGGGYGFHALSTLGTLLEHAALEKDDDAIQLMTSTVLRYLDRVEVTTT